MQHQAAVIRKYWGWVENIVESFVSNDHGSVLRRDDIFTPWLHVDNSQLVEDYRVLIKVYYLYGLIAQQVDKPIVYLDQDTIVRYFSLLPFDPSLLLIVPLAMSRECIVIHEYHLFTFDE